LIEKDLLILDNDVVPAPRITGWERQDGADLIRLYQVADPVELG
jgi:hypothetical protein